MYIICKQWTLWAILKAYCSSCYDPTLIDVNDSEVLYLRGDKQLTGAGVPVPSGGSAFCSASLPAAGGGGCDRGGWGTPS